MKKTLWLSLLLLIIPAFLYAAPTVSGGGGAAGDGANVSDAAYDATTWDGVTTIVPSKNAMRDYLESKLPSGSDGTYGVLLLNNTTYSPIAGTYVFTFAAGLPKIVINGTKYSLVYSADATPITLTTGGSTARTVTLPDANVTIPATPTGTIAANTASLGTAEIASGACAAAVTVSGTGIATTDVLDWGFNGDPTGVTGYAPTVNGMLTIIAYPTTNNANFKVCNNTASAITPSAVTLNWKVRR